GEAECDNLPHRISSRDLRSTEFPTDQHGGSGAGVKTGPVKGVRMSRGNSRPQPPGVTEWTFKRPPSRDNPQADSGFETRAETSPDPPRHLNAHVIPQRFCETKPSQTRPACAITQPRAHWSDSLTCRRKMSQVQS